MNTPEENTRICTICKQEKPLTLEFFYCQKSAKLGFTYQCKICRAAKDHSHYQKNKEKYKNNVAKRRSLSEKDQKSENS